MQQNRALHSSRRSHVVLVIEPQLPGSASPVMLHASLGGHDRLNSPALGPMVAGAGAAAGYTARPRAGAEKTAAACGDRARAGGVPRVQARLDFGAAVAFVVFYT